MNEPQTLTRLTLGPLASPRELRSRPERLDERAERLLALRPVPVAHVRAHEAMQERGEVEEQESWAGAASEPRPVTANRELRARAGLPVFTPPLHSASPTVERATRSPIAESLLRPASAVADPEPRVLVETTKRVVEPRIFERVIDAGPMGVRRIEQPELPTARASEGSRVGRWEPGRASSSEAVERSTAVTLGEQQRFAAPPMRSMVADPRPVDVQQQRRAPQPSLPAPAPASSPERLRSAKEPRPPERQAPLASTARAATPAANGTGVERAAAKLSRVVVDASAPVVELRPRRVASADPRPIARPRAVVRGSIAPPRPNQPAPASVRVSVGRIEIRTASSPRVSSRRPAAPARAHAITPVMPGVV